MLKIFIKKFSLILFGIIFSLIVLEYTLRLIGFIVSHNQQFKNEQILANDSTYTIMCLGESTTQWQWPIQLQELLTEKYGNKFSVIDCGIAGTNLQHILESLEENIDKYHPNVAICMMGINDGFSCLNDNNIVSINKLISNSKFKLFRLFILLKESIVSKLQKYDTQYIDINELQLINDLLKNENESTKTKNIENFIYIDTLINCNKITEAEKLLIDLLKTKPNNDWAFSRLFTLHKYIMGYSNEYCYSKAIYALDHNFVFGRQEYYKTIFEYYIQNNDIPSIKFYIKKALKDTKNLDFLLCFYRQIKRYCDEEDIQVLQTYSNSKILSNIQSFKAIYYLEQKNYENAKKYFDQAESLRLKYPNIVTYNQYKQIIRKLINNNIKVFCMQYPIRSTESLEEQLKNEPYYNKITFISNEKLFKEALLEKNYDSLFIDQFAEDFGHCTDLGNTMIAKNIIKNLEKALNLTQINSSYNKNQ